MLPDNMRLRGTHQASGCKAKVQMCQQIYQLRTDDSNLSAEVAHSHADDGRECLGH